MAEIKAPFTIPKRVFLAGSIEMGKAEHWQERVVRELSAYDVEILNPRKDDWDSTWVQSADNAQFFQQVDWELDAMERADLILMYFAPECKAPITLLEFGLHAKDRRLLLCCPDGFWRKGNVDVVCLRYGVTTVKDLSTLIAYAKASLTQSQRPEKVEK